MRGKENMERLTERELYDRKVCFTKCAKTNCRDKCAYCDILEEAKARLKEYEDLDEQGKLPRLPCAVGDTVYVIGVDEENFTHFYCPRKILEYKFNLQMLDLLGKYIFLTREEAEEAMKRMEGKG